MSSTVSNLCSDSCIERHSIYLVEGELDLISADDLQRSASATMDADGPELTLDMSGVTFMDCAGLNMLVLVRKDAISRGGHLTLSGVTPMSSRLLQVFGLHGDFGLPEPVRLVSVPRQVQVAPPERVS